MSFSEILRAPNADPVEIAVLVLPRASILEVASVLDPLRAANRHLGAAQFRWRVVTPDGEPAPLTCGIELPSIGGLDSAIGADLLIVVAGYDQMRVASRHLIAGLRRHARRFRAIGGVDAGPWILARAGLLDGHRATVHWEDLEDFGAAFPAIDTVPDRYVVSRNRFTAGGAGPAADLMLFLIGERCGAAVAGQVADSFLFDHAGSGARPQRPGLLPGARDARVSAALSQMSANLEDPLSLNDIAKAQSIGMRRLEQIFRETLGQGPGAAYLELRLQAAQRLMTDTSHSVRDVALRTGFADPTSFSRAFRRRFQMSPTSLRKPQRADVPSDSSELSRGNTE